MNEIPAVVVEEKKPEPPNFEPLLVQWVGPEGDHSGAEVFRDEKAAEECAKECRRDNYHARILRVSPPQPEKRREVVIDKDAFIKEWNSSFPGQAVGVLPMKIWDMIKRHATIREVDE